MRHALLYRPLAARIPVPVLRRTFSTSPLQPTSNPSPDSKHTEQQLQPEDHPPPQQSLPTNSLIYPPSPSPHHIDLPSFLAHATRTNLDPSSTVYVGTHFEYTTIQSLARYGLSLRRIGGVSDCGIDLLGVWPSLPTASSSSTPLRVLAQCKAVQRPGPHLVRELEGAFAAAPAGWRGKSGVVGLLVTEKPATKGIREALGRSRWPMGFVACSRAGKVEQFLWNRRAEGEGLEGVEVRVRYAEDGGKELVLMWRGKVLEPVEEGGEVGG